MDMLDVVNKFEKFFYGALIVMLMIILVFALGELAYTIIVSLTNPGSPTNASNVTNLLPAYGLLENKELLNVLGIFLLVLIGIELLDTMMEYFRENAIHVEIVVLLAIIAIARKVILLDPSQMDGVELIGIGVIILGLSGAYFLIRKAGFTIGSKGIERKE
jgi:uncharacterized membrane protein (DUF373 family)